ncbi:unnamed protein product, partial [Ectocarpus sp. 12 AP-2014]
CPPSCLLTSTSGIHFTTKNPTPPPCIPLSPRSSLHAAEKKKICTPSDLSKRKVQPVRLQGSGSVDLP